MCFGWAWRLLWIWLIHFGECGDSLADGDSGEFGDFVEYGGTGDSAYSDEFGDSCEYGNSGDSCVSGKSNKSSAQGKNITWLKVAF